MSWTESLPRNITHADRKALRNFGLVIALPVVIIAVILFWKGHASGYYWSGAAVVLALLGLIAPVVLKPLYLIWMTFAFVLSIIMTYLLLTLFFFLVMTPVALVMKLLGKDLLNRKFPGNQATYWVDAEVYDKSIERYSKPY